ncbi:MAG: DUF262 domain-containing protein [Desulfobacterota bacterium]|jgi:uncharacterized protein with ParB-like and HNH nuclease domain|nr:DUF262 domain-containing protein [Thermodesulfobacteriota bacterium]
MIDTNREITTSEKGIGELVRMLEGKKLLIPPFQREFVWEPEDVLTLWDSLYRFYPIGSLLCWESSAYLRVHRRAGGQILPGTEGAGGKSKKWLYLLDGQQRATALLVSILGAKARVKQTFPFDYTLYFDAAAAEFFFENGLNKRKRSVNPRFLIGLMDVFERGAALAADLTEEPGFTTTIANNLKPLIRVFTDYKIPLIRLRGFDIPAVREIFERINQQGKDLKSLDIMIARTFQNYEYLVEDDLP